MFELTLLALIDDQGFPSINVLEDRRKVLGAAHVVTRTWSLRPEVPAVGCVSQLVPFDDFTTPSLRPEKEPPGLLENL